MTKMLTKMVALFDEAKTAGDSEVARTVGNMIASHLGIATYHRDAEVTASELRIAKCHGKIEAIKAYRDRTKLGLKESKDNIEAAMSSLGLQFYSYRG